MREITVEQYIQMDNAVPVDVRSPIEFEACSIPGAVNVPLFSNEERVEIGTLYKKEGSDAAKWRAMEIVSPKIPSMLKKIRDLKEKGLQPVIYCWRGGMRSKAVTTFISYAGVSIPRLIGGYRAYRQYILENTPDLIPEKAVVLHGMTGVGKTDVLKVLSEKGYPVIDLEEMAGHRGSIFGSFGMGDGSTQKTFDALLYEALSVVKGSPYIIMEAESKRIGKAVQPDKLLDTKRTGIHIDMFASIESRVQRILRDYVEPYQAEEWFKPKVIESLVFIKKRLKDQEIRTLLDEAIEKENYELFIKLLLEHYYDPRYAFKQHDYEGEFHHVNADDVAAAAEEVIKFIENQNAPVV
ncbi:tRNA 2-selenouridine(34) synthase MnmH [Cytobacillus sp. NCCP-133]|uniref:tRNA 2-selenouridine(34) synthase MnmH n=1 Tax=Cytobacillus sp. NCCP-133 TaxID=766848 RepID=UPI00222F56D2|nr:tRNA 2-selenouridine(34) synthase MnmH [Cytobacillus sp. NCCP-133]GLB59930.1 tRNA 2-selenouridine synthase [Cytobacillus sp. NCCP-133]